MAASSCGDTPHLDEWIIVFPRAALLRFASSLFVSCAVAPRVAQADESAYCRKVKARAAADSILLMAPKLSAEALHFPASSRPSLARESGSGGPGIELRAGLSYSPIDAVRGKLLTSVGEADCQYHDAATEIDDVLLEATDRSELAAHRAEAEHLAARHPDWQRTLQEAEGALTAGLLTLSELHDLRRSTRDLDERWLEAQLEVMRLEARLDGQRDPRKRGAGGSAALGRSYIERAGELDRAVSKLRAFDPWSFQLTGGVATLTDEQRPAWFGFAELSYSLGGLFRGASEASYLRARDEELRQAPYERAGKLSAFRKLVGVEFANARRRLESTEAELTYLRQALGSFDGVDATSAAQGRTKVLLEQISVETDAVFLRAKLRELVSLLETIRDS
jgi:hypothetical protein